jgi:hypothetical protein
MSVSAGAIGTASSDSSPRGVKWLRDDDALPSVQEPSWWRVDRRRGREYFLLFPRIERPQQDSLVLRAGGFVLHADHDPRRVHCTQAVHDDSRGLISGHWTKDRAMAANDFRAHAPRFAAGSVERNRALCGSASHHRRVPEGRVAQMTIAWVLSRGNDIVPLIGARRRDRLREALGRSVAAQRDGRSANRAGCPTRHRCRRRYAAPVMTTLDSER